MERKEGQLSPPAVWREGWPQTPREFARLVEAFQDRLVGFAFRRLGSRADAEDVAQEVLVRAYAQRARLRSVGSVGAYLFRMTANLCIDELRKRAVRQNVSLEVPGVLELPDRDPGGHSEAAAREELARIQRLLAQVPEPQAEAIRLCVLDELSAREAAEVVRCPEATLKSRLRAGLLKLREIINEKREV